MIQILLLAAAALPAAAFTSPRIPSGTAPLDLCMAGTVLAEPPPRGEYVSLGVGSDVRYLTIEEIRSFNRAASSIDLLGMLQSNWPNLNVRLQRDDSAEQLLSTTLGENVKLRLYLMNPRGHAFLVRVDSGKDC